MAVYAIVGGVLRWSTVTASMWADQAIATILGGDARLDLTELTLRTVRTSHSDDVDGSGRHDAEPLG